MTSKIHTCWTGNQKFGLCFFVLEIWIHVAWVRNNTILTRRILHSIVWNLNFDRWVPGIFRGLIWIGAGIQGIEPVCSYIGSNNTVIYYKKLFIYSKQILFSLEWLCLKNLYSETELSESTSSQFIYRKTEVEVKAVKWIHNGLFKLSLIY